MNDLACHVESILFVASKPLSAKSIAKALNVNVEEVQVVFQELISRHNTPASGIHILANGDEVQMTTNPASHESVVQFVENETVGELTKAQLETLTVIAYRGPVSRPELEQIRGVNCAVIIRTLLMRGLIDEAEGVGLLPVYRISVDALRYLGISSPMELPNFDTLHAHEYLLPPST